MKFFRNIKALFLLLALPAILLITNNTFSNRHVHVLPEGILIIHAHPGSTQDGSLEHEHTESEMFHLAQIHHLFVGDGIVEQYEFVLYAHKIFLETELNTGVICSIVHETKGRSPPAFII